MNIRYLISGCVSPKLLTTCRQSIASPPGRGKTQPGPQGGNQVMKSLLKTVLVSTALMSFASIATAAETVVWWDFLGGGDGVRMKKLIEDFNTEHSGKIEIQGTTLDWGVPFYTKVQTSAAVG